MFENYKGLIDLEFFLKSTYGCDKFEEKDMIKYPFISYEGAGASARFWVTDKNNEKYLFKYSESFPEATLYGELISKKICNILGLASAEVRACKFKDKIGILSKKVISDDELIINGGEIIQYVLSNYSLIANGIDDSNELAFLENKNFLQLYSIPADFNKLKSDDKVKYTYNNLNNLEQLWAIVDLYIKGKNHTVEERILIIDYLVKLFIFDLIMMQADRHIENWGVVLNKITNNFLPCPYYDNAGVLGLDYKNLDSHIDIFNSEYQIFLKNYPNNQINFINLLYKNRLLLTVSEDDILNALKRKRKNNIEVLESFLKISDSIYIDLLVEYIKKAKSIDIHDILTEIEFENGIIIPQKIKDYIQTNWNCNLLFINKCLQKYNIKGSESYGKKRNK